MGILGTKDSSLLLYGNNPLEYTPPTTPYGAIAHWTFNNTLEDEISNNHFNLIDGSISYVSGKIGNCLKLHTNIPVSPNRSVIECTSNSMMEITRYKRPFTIAWWCNIPTPSAGTQASTQMRTYGVSGGDSDQNIYFVAYLDDTHGNVWWFGRQPEGETDDVLLNAGFPTGTPYRFIASTWYLSIMTFDGDSTTKGYMYKSPGGLVAIDPSITSSPFSANLTTDYFRIHSNGYDPFTNTAGILYDSMWVWDRELTLEEIDGVWNNGNGI